MVGSIVAKVVSGLVVMVVGRLVAKAVATGTHLISTYTPSAFQERGGAADTGNVLRTPILINSVSHAAMDLQ